MTRMETAQIVAVQLWLGVNRVKSSDDDDGIDSTENLNRALFVYRCVMSSLDTQVNTHSKRINFAFSLDCVK